MGYFSLAQVMGLAQVLGIYYSRTCIKNLNETRRDLLGWGVLGNATILRVVMLHHGAKNPHCLSTIHVGVHNEQIAPPPPPPLHEWDWFTGDHELDALDLVEDLLEEISTCAIDIRKDHRGRRALAKHATPYAERGQTEPRAVTTFQRNSATDPPSPPLSPASSSYSELQFIETAREHPDAHVLEAAAEWLRFLELGLRAQDTPTSAHPASPSRIVRPQAAVRLRLVRHPAAVIHYWSIGALRTCFAAEKEPKSIQLDFNPGRAWCAAVHFHKASLFSGLYRPHANMGSPNTIHRIT
ncbi:hypothetical protein C8R44DRAFT_741867 [Mycena epipterygia]|nr:hypothetical protein C8R44DRAFT_741867 [Mycena epipterygia]